MINDFLKTVQAVLDSMGQKSPIFKYEKPLMEHAGEALKSFQKEYADDISKYLKEFFDSTKGSAKSLFESELNAVRKSVEELLGYKKARHNKAISIILTVIASIKNIISDYLKLDPSAKAAMEMFEEAISFLKI
ncbi:hypothetical protein [Vreelandella jeotgali]|uniref:hypothetical protein n=1 Tax=Vreelandella jeotgali TaxID=553386 RepID=UPI0003676459|nr:hypothetical protein [Halomonas jeotgali]